MDDKPIEQVTPFDIAPIPYSPFTPSNIAWGGLIIVAAILIFAYRLSHHLYKIKNINIKATTALKLREELQNLRQLPSIYLMQRVSQILKLFISTEYHLSLETYSPLEIAQLKIPSMPEEQHEILVALAECDALKFSPHITLEKAEQLIMRSLRALGGEIL